MAEYFVGPVMEKLIEYLKDQVRWQTGRKEELQSLQENHHKIKAILSVYNQVEIQDQALNKWYWQLRDAVDEADDVLDELEYRKLEKSIKKRFDGFFPRIFKSDPTLKRLEEVVQKLSKISAEVGTFQNLLDRANQEQQQQQLELHEKREEGSIPINELVGRIQQIDFVSQWLRNPSQTGITNTTDFYRNISLLSVVGHGGMGKTALLQRVYSDGTTVGFDIKMWACVSNNFKPKTAIKNILESLGEKRSTSETLEALQNTLKSKVTSKRFLLVLDDIWEDDEMEWKKVLAPLNYGSPGSKILITTRMNSVASMFKKMINNKQILKLEGLEKDKCLWLLEKHAFFGIENPDHEYKSMAVKMVEKLSGCPLAAKMIGGILNSDVLDKNHWRKVLNANIRNIRSDQNHLLPVLKLSYIYLPKFLQNCFAFCSVFPQDYEFDKDDLVRMWIALGFIQSSNIFGETDLEDTGRRYFNILVQKSFFDEFRSYYGIVYYKMHDILHELAQSVSTEECLTVMDDRACSNPKTIRHLSIDISSSLEAAFKMIGEFKNLRSLFLSFSEAAKFDVNIISENFKAWKSIRLLHIYVPNQQDIPERIDCLTHLRYLSVQFDSFSMPFKLPRSISHLHHLQFIDFPKLQNLENLKNLEMDNTGWKVLKTNENCQLITDTLVIKDPCVLEMEPVRSITSLQILEIEENGELVSFSTGTEMFLQQSSSLYELKFQKLQSLQCLPSSLESLSSLAVLQVYDVPQLKLLPNPSASLVSLELHNLESLQCLPSSLSTLSSLSNIELKNIPLLKSLPDLPSSLEKLVLEDLESLQCLPSSLSTISSFSYLELKNIPLLKSLQCLSSLKYLYLTKLELLDCLPSCLPFLRELAIKKVPRLLELPDLPSSLEKLVLEDLESLQCLPSSLSTISSFSYLELKNIPLLKSLPDLPSSLKILYLQQLESLQCLPSSLSTISSFSYLELKNIPLLKSLPDLPSSLKQLDLQQLESLQCLPSSLSTISSLLGLKLINIPLLKSLPDLPSSLKALILEELESLQCPPSSLSTISSLSYLMLKNIPLLKSLPDLPSSLKALRLEELESLQCPPSSLSTISSLPYLIIKNIPLLKSLQCLSSLKYLYMAKLELLDCLPSCLPILRQLEIKKVPRLLELPDLPTCLEYLLIEDCHPQLMDRYENFDIRVNSSDLPNL